jgi:hypothetical protein
MIRFGFVQNFRLELFAEGLWIKRGWSKPRVWHEKCNWVKYPVFPFHFNYGDKYPTVLTKNKEKKFDSRPKNLTKTTDSRED